MKFINENNRAVIIERPLNDLDFSKIESNDDAIFRTFSNRRVEDCYIDLDYWIATI